MFLMPGIIIQNAIFGATTTAIGIAEDLKSGLVDRFRSLPMARSAMLAGRATSDLVKNFILLLVVIGIGYLVGFSFQNGFLNALAMIVLVMAVSFTFSWVMAAIALSVKKLEAVQAAAFTGIFPLVFMSSALVPVEGMADWVQVIARNNPITHWANLARYFAVGEFPNDGRHRRGADPDLRRLDRRAPRGLHAALDPAVLEADVGNRPGAPGVAHLGRPERTEDMPLLGFKGDNAREKVIVLLTMCFALAMAMLDNTVVNIALPTIQRELGATVSDLQWIIDGYVLAFASLLLTGGILGDRYGRKRMFLTGLAIFTLASLGCGLSGSGGQLIAFRALQGVGAALLMPGTLSILTVTFPPEERARAIGLWAGVSGLALALGPTLGGYIVEHAGWETVFFINVPIGIIAFAIAWRTVRESVSEETRHLDLPGLALGTGGLFALTYGLIEANQRGWSDPLIVGSLVLAGILLVAFLVWEHRSPKAMMPLSFFRIPAFSAGNTVAFSVSLGMFSIFLFVTLYMQAIRGYTPFETGLRFLPMTVMIIVTAPIAGPGRAADRREDPDDLRAHDGVGRPARPDVDHARPRRSGRSRSCS